MGVAGFEICVLLMCVMSAAVFPSGAEEENSSMIFLFF